MEIFDMRPTGCRCKTHWTPFLDGEWRVLDFGDTDEPGVSWRANMHSFLPGLHRDRMKLLRQWANRRLMKAQQMIVNIPEDMRKVRMCMRVISVEQYLDETCCARQQDVIA